MARVIPAGVPDWTWMFRLLLVQTISTALLNILSLVFRFSFLWEDDVDSIITTALVFALMVVVLELIAVISGILAAWRSVRARFNRGFRQSLLTMACALWFFPFTFILVVALRLNVEALGPPLAIGVLALVIITGTLTLREIRRRLREASAG